MKGKVTILSSLALFAVPAVQASDPGRATPEIAYEGDRFSAAEVSDARSMIEDAFPAALAAAESVLALELDDSRLVLRLADHPPTGRSSMLYMRTGGYSPVTIEIRLEPLIRGSYTDLPFLRRALTHEFIHAILRQHASPEAYRRLPDWFQEGVASALASQGDDKLASELVWSWREGLAGLPARFDDPDSLTWGLRPFVFMEVMEDRGLESVRTLVNHGIAEGSTSAAFAAIGLSEADALAAARARVEAAIAAYLENGGEALEACMESYEEGEEKRLATIRCLLDLAVDHPGTPAEEISRYWLAKCYYHIRRFDDARRSFDRFVDTGGRYGLLDDVAYYRIRMLVADHRFEEAGTRCDAYFKLFPDGNQLVKVAAIRRKLTEEQTSGER